MVLLLLLLLFRSISGRAATRQYRQKPGKKQKKKQKSYLRLIIAKTVGIMFEFVFRTVRIYRGRRANRSIHVDLNNANTVFVSYAPRNIVLVSYTNGQIIYPN